MIATQQHEAFPRTRAANSAGRTRDVCQLERDDPAQEARHPNTTAAALDLGDEARQATLDS